MIKVLYVASEVVPFVKTGGLADVAFSLPKELKKLGVDIRVVLPKYKDIPEKYNKSIKPLTSFEVEVGWRKQYCGIEQMRYKGVTFYLVDNEYYFKRDGLYGFYDDGERYAFFCRAVLETINNLDLGIDIMHCNDWHSGMISTLLHAHYRKNPKFQKIKTLFTIHNLKYQGVFSKDILWELLNLGPEYYNIDSLEFNGGVSFMKGAIKYSNLITTVSETYAEEIQIPFYGEGLDGLLRGRKDDIRGIVNGIDYGIYNPKKDRNILVNYDMKSIEKKVENKIKLQRKLKLPKERDIPLIGMVSRLVKMKGIDLVIHILEELLSRDVQIVILGTGSFEFESRIKEIAHKYPNKLSANIEFDNRLAHRIYAASDMFLMPSLFEPCGLGQLIALRYGTIPIVRETGGLSDTVTSYNESTGEGNGFSFTNYNAHDMLYTIDRALKLYRDKATWKKIIENAMIEDYSWSKSAHKYKAMYEELID